MTIDAGRWTMSFNPGPESRFRLVCFPHAGGSAGSFFPLVRAAPPGLEVVGVQYPGRQWRRTEPAVADIHLLARGAADALLAERDLPTAVLGHSMGALVAFETVRLLEEKRPGAVTHLFASGSRAPSCHTDEARPARWSDERIIAELRGLGGTGDRLISDEEGLRSALPALRDDYRALAAYRPAPGARVGVPLTVLVGREDPKAGPEHAADWQPHTDAAFDFRVFPGGHFFLNENVAELLDLVRIRQL
ncbi:thioesterase II family protein [Streptomyces sp. BE133]|uniref:thioesterase II family protein n=1 Tax=Streptomyces sp. BE133 TaxID=3002523 RepID=UPI002E79AC53|nr:alpha/beta fold hydrolase [Streptomyces sp. BE133]MEE1805531.1 alpha/beta fold hydrolase [Streptomyces sp. BE133]